MENTIVIYGLADARQKYQVAQFYVIPVSEGNISNLKRLAGHMRIHFPAVQSVYAIDNRPGLKREYTTTVRKNTIENCIVFKTILETEGIKII